MPDLRRKRRGLRLALIAVAVLILLPIAAAGVFLAQFDPNAWKPQIAAAVQRATGRQLALKGKLDFRLLPMPTLQAADVAFANMADGSRPEMATLQQVAARIAFWPLLSGHVVIDSLTLTRPDILLETDATGHANWQFGPGTPTKPLPQATPPATPRQGRAVSIAVRSIAIDNGKLTWRDGRTGHRVVLDLPDFTVTSASATSPVAVAGKVLVQGVPIAVQGQAGSLARLRDAAATTPFPVRLSLDAAGAHASLDGTVLHPLSGQGYAARINATVPALERLAPLFPHALLPPVHDLTLSAKIADSGTPIPALTDLTLRAGASDLQGVVPGLTLAKLDLAVPRPGAVAKLDLAGTLHGAALVLSGTVGTPALGAMPALLPIDLSGGLGAARFVAKGQVAPAHPLAAFDLAVSAQVPDLAALSAPAGRPLPGLKNVAFSGQVSGGLAGAHGPHLGVQHLKLTMAQGDLAGTVALVVDPVPKVTAGLTAKRLDLDALRAALPAARPSPLSGAPPARADAPAAKTAAKPAPHAAPARLFSDRNLPFATLLAGDADVTLSAADLRAGGADYHNVALHLGLSNGRLAIDRFSARTPGGAVSGQLQVDAARPVPPVALKLHAPGLDAATLLATFGLPAEASGKVFVDADLSGAGRTPHAIAAGLNGHLGIAMTDGEVDNRLVASLFGEVLRSAGLGAELAGNLGRSKINCFALRLSAAHGVAQVDPLLLDTARLHLEGNGTIDLGPETLALQLRPLARFGKTGVAVPVRVGGTLLAPKSAIDTAVGVQGALAGLAHGGKTFTAIIGALNDRATTQACPAALAAARGERAPAAAPAKPQAAPKKASPRDLLRRLFR